MYEHNSTKTPTKHFLSPFLNGKYSYNILRKIQQKQVFCISFEVLIIVSSLFIHLSYILLDGYNSLLSIAAMYIAVIASLVAGLALVIPLKSVNA